MVFHSLRVTQFYTAFLIALGLLSLVLPCEGSTSPPPQIVFVPMANAIAAARHPTLPLLYVTREGMTESKNLFTYRLNPDGTIDGESQRVCDDYFSADGKKPSFPHRLLRVTIDAEKRVLYLAAYPIVANSVITYSDTNNFEYAAVALDEQGQPTKRLKLFRTDVTGTQGLTGIRYEPSLRRLFFNYYSSTHWSDTDKDGVPLSTSPTKWFNAGVNFWSWKYVPEWSRFYQTRAASHMAIVPVSPDNLQIEFIQYTNPQQGPQMYGHIEVSTRFRKIYLLDSDPQKELIVFPLSAQGRLIGVPRYFNLGPTVAMRCDFKAGLLFAFNRGVIRVFKLDPDGFPTGPSEVSSFEYGDLWDLFMDESTGKLYVCTTKEQP